MPENGPVHYQFSQTLRRAGKKDEADREAALSEKLSHEKEESAQALAIADQGLSLVQHGRTREGLAKIKQALAISPDNLTGHFDYALALRQVGRYDESIAHLQKVLLQQPDMPAAHYQLGCDYFKKGQYQEAVSYFYRAARLIPGTAVVHNGLGVALAKTGDISGAIGELQVAHKLDPKTKLYGKNLDCVQRPSPGCGLTP
jgi:Flp pilus assembly protein TadD